MNRMGRIRLFPLLFQNGCSQSSRFPTAGTRLGSIELRVNLVPRAFVTLVQQNGVFIFPFRWTKVTKALGTRLVADALLQLIASKIRSMTETRTLQQDKLVPRASTSFGQVDIISMFLNALGKLFASRNR